MGQKAFCTVPPTKKQSILLLYIPAQCQKQPNSKREENEVKQAKAEQCNADQGKTD